MISSNAQPPLVLKLGGSLLEAGRMSPILEIVARATRPIALVPGGGPFADGVRAAQRKLHFDDATAHRLAILAMHQTAHVLMAMQPRLGLAETLGDFKKITTRGGIPVWLPTRLCEKDRRIPRDWSITSDGLAARLAERLDARSIVLVKSTRVAAGTPLSDVVKSGIADPAFADIVARAKLDWRILGPGEEQALAELIGAKI